MPTPEDVYTSLKDVYDPEIPVNIVDLGLVYGVEILDGTCRVQMTLTSRTCPEAQRIPDDVKRRLSALEGIEETAVEIVWEPQWSPHRISAEGRRVLGIEEPQE